MIKNTGLSLQHKLIGLMLFISAVAVLIMASAVIIYQAFSARYSLENQLSTLAQVIGSQSTGALFFNDKITAQEKLDTLSAKPGIVYAAILNEDGNLFVFYPSDFKAVSSVDDTNPNKWLNQLLPLFTSNIEVSKDIVLEGDKIGSIVIRSDLTEFHNNLLAYVTMMLLAVLFCVAIAFLLSALLHKIIMHPILELRNNMALVSHNQDYSVRMDWHSDDELSLLVDSFNDMLEQIQKRDVELERYSENLQHEIEKRSIELEETNRRRIMWLENMARFLRHELKNTTVGVKTSLDLIERRVPSDTISVYINRARKSIYFMNSLLDSVGNASTLEASFFKEESQPVDLSELVSARYHDYRNIYPEQSLILKCEDDIMVNGIETRLYQMMDNLVSNAVEHCREGGVVTIGLSQIEGQAQLTISDEGDRLPADKESIFELFVSMRKIERKTQENFGLGLYIVKLIVEKQGGKVVAKDLDYTSGAVFTVTLPILETMD